MQYPTEVAGTTPATVLWIYDGDTVEVSTGSGKIDVRLLDINAPEGDECQGDVATNHLITTLKDRPVELDVRGTDQFGRTLAVIWDGDRNVNLEMVTMGLAIATSPVDPAYASAETEAVSGDLGLWAPDSCSKGPLRELVIDVSRSASNPPGPDDENLEGERVFIRNDSGEKVDMSGWMLRDESSRHRFTFPAGTNLEPGESWMVASSDPGWDPGGSPVWNNDGDIVMLLDPNGRVVDHWRYGP